MSDDYMDLRLQSSGECSLCMEHCSFASMVLFSENERIRLLGFCHECTNGGSNIRNLILTVRGKANGMERIMERNVILPSRGYCSVCKDKDVSFVTYIYSHSIRRVSCFCSACAVKLAEKLLEVYDGEK